MAAVVAFLVLVSGTERRLLAQASTAPSTYRRFEVQEVAGRVVATKPLPDATPPRWAKDVSQQVKDWTGGPDLSKPYFEGPVPFVLPPADAGEPFHKHNHQPSITWLANGDLLVIWYSTDGETGTEMTVLASRLRAGRQVWDPSSEFFKAADRNMTGSALFHDGKGTLYHFNGMGQKGVTGWSNLAMLLRTSTDNGVTWTLAQPIGPEFTRRHQIISGTIRTSKGALIQCCDAVPGGNGGTALHISLDGGKTWSDPGAGKSAPRFAPGGRGDGTLAGIHGGVVELKDGRLLALGRGDTINGHMPLSLSTDLGRTWTYQASPFLPIGGGQRLVLRRLREGPLLLVSFTSGNRSQPEADGLTFKDKTGKEFVGHGMFAALSFDEGDTWPVRKLLTPGQGDFDGGAHTGRFTATPTRAEHAGYLAATQTPDGVVHLISSRLYYRFNLAWLQELSAPVPPSQPTERSMRELWDREPVPAGRSEVEETVEREFRAAEKNARAAAEGLYRCRKYVDAWLAHADPTTGLIPRGLGKGKWLHGVDTSDVWNGRDAGADNYPFMVLTCALIDRPMFEGPMLDILKAEIKYCCRVDRLGDNYCFSKGTFLTEKPILEEVIFDNAEYVKDGLIPLTEWLGKSPWSDRAVALIEDIWKQATIETPCGQMPTQNFEVNGDLLQACSRLYWFTGDKQFLDWATRLGDYYLLGDQHPTRNMKNLRLRDHGCEAVNGLTELYAALKNTRPQKAETYRKPLHAMLDRILAAGRNEHGMLYDSFNPQTGAHSKGLCDTWGYTYDAFYTVYLLDQTTEYREAVRQALSHLQAHYRNYPWEGQSADGYADSLESAINLYNREPLDSTAGWIDSEIRVMWAKQQASGFIEGWHGDGNFARTTVMYVLWKTQGLHIEPWRADVRIGAVKDGDDLLISLAADQPWSGKVVFDRPRHQTNLHMPVDYPRINQFPEWFTVSEGAHYEVKGLANGKTCTYDGRQLAAGMDVTVPAQTELRLIAGLMK